MDNWNPSSFACFSKSIAWSLIPSPHDCLNDLNEMTYSAKALLLISPPHSIFSQTMGDTVRYTDLFWDKICIEYI
jgi:hypothetical protein